MGFKIKQRNLTFSDLEKSAKDKKNRSLETLMNMDKTIAWDKIESILLKDYPVGDKKEGNKAYSPLLLFKCLLIQKWFRIKSDPELESQINDRNSFQTFLGLSSSEASPEYADTAATSNESRSGFVKVENSYSDLIDESISNLLNKAEEIRGDKTGIWVEKDPFAGLVAEQPKAILYCMYSWKSHKQHEIMIRDIKKYSGIFLEPLARRIENMNPNYHVCEICGSTVEKMPTLPCEICNYSISHYQKLERPILQKG